MVWDHSRKSEMHVIECWSFKGVLSNNCSSVAYLMNRCPLIMLEMKTLEDIWLGHSPNLDNLRIFGCVAYAHMRLEKLDACVVQCMVLSFSKGVKGYHIWCLKLRFKKCIINQDVIFNENYINHESRVSECEPWSSHDG